MELRDIALMNIAYCMMRREIREMKGEWAEELEDSWHRFDNPLNSEDRITDAEYLDKKAELEEKWQPRIDQHERLAESLLSVLEYQAGDEEEEVK